MARSLYVLRRIARIALIPAKASAAAVLNAILTEAGSSLLSETGDALLLE